MSLTYTIIVGLAIMLATGFVAGVLWERAAIQEHQRECERKDNQYFIHPRHNKQTHCDRRHR